MIDYCSRSLTDNWFLLGHHRPTDLNKD